MRGLEKLEGTYPFTIDRSVKAFRLNTFLHELIEAGLPQAVPGRSGAVVRAMPARRRKSATWSAAATGAALIHYGVIFFLLEKFGAVVGTTNLHIYAAMRGQSLEDFQKTRNAQVLYSVAGQDTGKTDWDKKGA